jgi:OmpA-OmpF porin, OOP family
MNMPTFTRKIIQLLFVLLCGFVRTTAVVADEAKVGASESKKPLGKMSREDPAKSEQLRVKNLIAKGMTLDNYSIALAQAWLDYGRETHVRKDRLASGEALHEARVVIDVIERHGLAAKIDARVIPSSSRLREDLWRRAEGYKRDAEIDCGAWPVARMEIALIAAGRADRDMGWRVARPYVQRAERLSREAEAKLQACAQVKIVVKKDVVPDEKKMNDAVPSAPKMEPASIAPGDMPKMPNRVHFSFESAEVSDISALVLEQVSYVLRGNPSLVIDVVGFANDLATSEENEKLALARAQAVQEYLIETGVGRERLAIRVDKSESGAETKTSERTKGRRVDFVPTSSDAIPMEYQDKDLATEGPKG